MHKNVILTIAVFLIGTLLGFSFGLSYGGSNGISGIGTDVKCSSQLEKCASQIEKAKKFFPSMPEMTFISGTIKKMNGNIITLESSPSSNPFEELPTIREATITESTKIIKQEQKNPTEFQKEVEDYQKKISQQSQANLSMPTPITPPSPFKETELKINDLKEGDRIVVYADKNIKTMASFEATKITVQSGGLAGPALPSAVPPPAAAPPAASATPPPAAAPPLPSVIPPPPAPIP